MKIVENVRKAPKIYGRMLSQPCACGLRNLQADGRAWPVQMMSLHELKEREVETRLCGAWELFEAKQAEIISRTDDFLLQANDIQLKYESKYIH